MPDEAVPDYLFRLAIGTPWARFRPAAHRECDAYTRRVNTIADRITVDPEQCGGRPCIRGMRIRVSDVLDLFAAGLTAEQILEEMPDLEAEDLQASLRFASRWLDHPVLVA